MHEVPQRPVAWQIARMYRRIRLGLVSARKETIVDFVAPLRLHDLRTHLTGHDLCTRMWVQRVRVSCASALRERAVLNAWWWLCRGRIGERSQCHDRTHLPGRLLLLHLCGDSFLHRGADPIISRRCGRRRAWSNEQWHDGRFTLSPFWGYGHSDPVTRSVVGSDSLVGCSSSGVTVASDQICLLWYGRLVGRPSNRQK